MMKFQKLHWIIWITFVCFHQLSNGKKFHKSIILDRYNDARQKAAKHQKISNMWKLEWDENLVNQAKLISKGHKRYDEFMKLRNGANYRIMLANFVEEDDFAVREEARKRFKAENEAIEVVQKIQENWKQEQDILESTFEGVVPVQRRIGCIEYWAVAYRNDYNGKSNGYEYHLLCLLGPHGFSTIKTVELGEPGTKCGEHGIGNSDGLCIEDPKNPFPQPTTTTTKAPKKKKNKKTEEDSDDYEESEKKRNREDDEYDLILDLNSVGEKGTVLVFVLVLVMVFLN